MIHAWYLGFKDGYSQGRIFMVGRTWYDWQKNETYDKGVNVGQLAARLLKNS